MKEYFENFLVLFCKLFGWTALILRFLFLFLFFLFHTNFFSFLIKNEFHDTIHVFKNYFATVLSVFNFSNNKLNPNGPFIEKKRDIVFV